MKLIGKMTTRISYLSNKQIKNTTIFRLYYCLKGGLFDEAIVIFSK